VLGTYESLRNIRFWNWSGQSRGNASEDGNDGEESHVCLIFAVCVEDGCLE